MVAENLAEIRARIAAAAARAGRSPDEVRIVAAAKSQGQVRIEEAIAAGIRIIGHNYLQEAERESPPAIRDRVKFHMIGHLQRNKAGKAVDLFDMVETVDDVRLATALNNRASQAGKVIEVMIQVNLAAEPQKSGIPGDQVEAMVEAITGLEFVRLKGLMTMPPFFDDPDRARPHFARLRELRDRLISKAVLTHDMKELSMGMTGDFEVAVEEGATLVRIGTALFGPRLV
jgi:pyridoxal phosphate enzyme (YggS family)